MKGNKITSYDFIWQLGESMIKPYIQYRRDNAGYLRRNITSAMQKIVPQDRQKVERAGAERGRRHLCLESIQGKGYKAKRQKLLKHRQACIPPPPPPPGKISWLRGPGKIGIRGDGRPSLNVRMYVYCYFNIRFSFNTAS